MVWGCSCESGVQEDLLVSSWLGHDTVPGNLTLLAARGMGEAGLAMPFVMPPDEEDGGSGEKLSGAFPAPVSAQVREGFQHKRQERVESRNKGTPVARERLPLLAAESAGQ